MIRPGDGVERNALRPPRVMGDEVGESPGPTLIAIGGVHGNEPAGVLAIERLLEKLQDRSLSLAGEFLALSGNRPGLASHRRFVDLDLNRLWSGNGAEGDGAGARADVLAVEELEQRELRAEIEAAAARARGPVHVIDIHTISGPGRPFATVGDAARNRPFALKLPVPLVLGLNRLVEGTLLGYLDRRGFANIAFESGQHDDPSAVDRAEAALWLSMEAVGLLREEEHGEIEWARAELTLEPQGVPRVLEMKYRHPLEDDDGFRMEPGYENLQTVHKGEVLARDNRGEIRAAENARILMPLYQNQGSDGFFLVKPTAGSG